MKKILLSAATLLIALFAIFGVRDVSYIAFPRQAIHFDPLRLLGDKVDAFYRPTVIKSIQRGSIVMTGAGSNTATITSVSTANSLLVYLGCSGSDASTSITTTGYGALTFTNATTITANRQNGTGNLTVSYEVIEFYPGVIKSMQRGSTVYVGATTATITSVNTAKTMVTSLGWLGDTNTFTASVSMMDVVLNSATQLLFSQGNGAATITMKWQVAEFY